MGCRARHPQNTGGKMKQQLWGKKLWQWVARSKCTGPTATRQKEDTQAQVEESGGAVLWLSLPWVTGSVKEAGGVTATVRPPGC